MRPRSRPKSLSARGGKRPGGTDEIDKEASKKEIQDRQKERKKERKNGCTNESKDERKRKKKRTSFQSFRVCHKETGYHPSTQFSNMAALSEQCVILNRFILVFFILSRSANVYGWDSIDLELFDLVEEIKDNFYDVLGLKQVSLTKFISWHLN